MCCRLRGVVLGPEFGGISMPEGYTIEGTREMRALKMERQSEEDRDIWVFSFGVCFQVKQKKIFFHCFLSAKVPRGAKPLLNASGFQKNFLALILGESTKLGKYNFTSWRGFFKLR